MSHRDLRAFLADLESCGELKRVRVAVDPRLEITEVCWRTLRAGGPALLFERPGDSPVPVLGNLFGSLERVTAAMGLDGPEGLREVGELLAFLREPQWPNGLNQVFQGLPAFRRLLHASPRVLPWGPCQEAIVEAPQVDLARLPVQTCWPEDAGPLITWGLVITRGPHKARCNVGVYRQQLIDRNKVIMRWLPHRGGAIDFQEWRRARPGEPFPVTVAIGADPALIIAAVTPVPDALSEFQFAGLLRGGRTELVERTSNGLPAPATAEFILEGHIHPEEEALEGPFGDHTGYYNAQDRFPVFTVERITHRHQPIYHSTYMGRSPYDEPSVLAMALNEVFVPILQKAFPEIVDFYLPPAACSYRVAVISIRKRYPGHARRVMLGVWSWLRQFTYTKFLIVTDEDIDVRDWDAVLWALSTRADPARDSLVLDHTPIDYLDFASPEAGLGGKLGIDATHKLPGETRRPWGRPIVMSPEVVARVDAIWETLWRSPDPEVSSSEPASSVPIPRDP